MMPTVAYNALLLRPPFAGVEKSVHALGHALTQRQRFNYRLLVAPAYSAAAAAIAAPHLQLPGWSSSRSGRIICELTLLPRLLRKSGCDLLHAPAYVAPPRLTVPTVLSLYDLHVYTHPHYCTRANRYHYRWRIPASLRAASAIIVPSLHTRNAVAQLFPAALPRTHVVPLGVADDYFQPQTAAELATIRRRYRLPEKFILAVGTLKPRKNPATLFAIWHRLRRQNPRLSLILTGVHQPLQLPPGVVAPGYIAEDDLPTLYRLAQALIYPSHDEGFGLPVLEAMASGCPVVCSDGAMREFAADAVLYADAGDPASAVSALNQILHDQPAARRFAELGRERAQLFTWGKTAAAVEQIYAQVLALSPP